MAPSAATTDCVSLGLTRREGGSVRVFLVGDAAACAKTGQKVSRGSYNIELMVRSVAKRGGVVGVCGTCMDARGITAVEPADGCHRSTLDEWTDWTQQADHVLAFSHDWVRTRHR